MGGGIYEIDEGGGKAEVEEDVLVPGLVESISMTASRGGVHGRKLFGELLPLLLLLLLSEDKVCGSNRGGGISSDEAMLSMGLRIISRCQLPVRSTSSWST